MPYPYGGNVPPGYQPPNIQGGYMSGGQQMAGGHQYYDPAQDPNYVKPNKRIAEGREKKNQGKYKKDELKKKWGGKLDPALWERAESGQLKPGDTVYTSEPRIARDANGKPYHVTDANGRGVYDRVPHVTPQDYSPQKYSDPNYKPSEYNRAYDPYEIRGQEAQLQDQYKVSPYGGQNQQGGQNVAQYPNQQAGLMPPVLQKNGQYLSGAKEAYDQYVASLGPNKVSHGVDSSGRTIWGPGQQTDPYQLPQGSKPQFSTANGGQPQISTVGNPNAADINPYIGPSNGPRPQQPPFAPGQQAYNGPKIKPMNNQPGKGIGFGGPTVFNQNFANTPYGQSQLPQNPYRPIQSRLGQQPQGQQWGY